MKKLLLLTLIFGATITTTVSAQGGGAQAASEQSSVLDQMKAKFTPMMVEKTGLTAAQADKVVELNYEMRMAAGGLKDLNEADRKIKIQELKAAKEKKFTEFLTADQITAVKNFFEELAKNAPPRGN
jgi:hypothetical protein